MMMRFFGVFGRVVGSVIAYAVTAAGATIIALLGLSLGVLGLIYKINKESADANAAAQKIIITKQEVLEAHTRSRIYAAARSGRTEEEVLKIYRSLATQSRTMFDGDVARQKAWLDTQMEGVSTDVLKAVTTAGMFTPLTERTPEQKKHEDDMRTISEKLLKVNEQQKDYLDKANKHDQETSRDAEIDAAKNRSWWRDFKGGVNILVHPSKWGGD